MTIRKIVQGVVIHRMITETGVNPQNVYCQITGAPIGQLTMSEWELIWDSLDPLADCDEIIDELYGRTIASMRPSPAWNYIRRGTLNRLRKSDPVRTCAFLLGRFFEPRDSAYSRVKRSYDDRIQDGINRIICFQKLQQCDPQSETFKSFVVRLFLLDADFDLSIVDYIPDFPKTPLDLDPAKFNDYIPLLQSYYDLLVARKLKLERQAKLEASRMSRGGNRMAREAATSAFMETKPMTEAQTAKKAADLASTMIANAIRLMMDGDDRVSDVMVKPSAAPIRVGGFKMGQMVKAQVNHG